jgi:hypothetical protein
MADFATGRRRPEAKHAKPIVMGQLRPGKAHSRSLGFARDDKAWSGASRGN